MEVVWTQHAISDLRELRSFIRKENPIAAKRVAQRILETAKLLEQQPSIGRPGRVPNTRELVVIQTPFLIPYSVFEDKIVVLRVLHGAKKWPRSDLG